MSNAIPVQPIQVQSRKSPTLSQRFHRMSETRFGLLLLTPTTLILLIFVVGPIIYALIMSFNQIELTVSADRDWVGLANYAGLLTNADIQASVPRTIYFAAITTVVGTLLALTLALLLNEPFRGRKAARVAILLPWAVAPVVNGIMWRYMFQPTYGLMNALLYSLGVIQHYIIWFDNSQVSLTIAAVATAWKELPFLTLFLLAALQGIPESLYRAAKMDGANILARFRYVTLPHLRTILVFCILLEVIVSLQVFDLIYTLTQGGGGAGQGAVVLSYQIFINAFKRLSLGNASALAVMLAIFILVLSGLSLTLLSNRRQKA